MSSIPKRIGKYIGDGRVYLRRDENLHRLIAVKVVPKDGDDQDSKWLQAEARKVARLRDAQTTALVTIHALHLQ